MELRCGGEPESSHGRQLKREMEKQHTRYDEDQALPGAIAAKLIYPEKRVLAVTGDGGFMMNSQELETAKRLGVPIIILIFNDCSYGLNMQRASGSKGTALKKQRIFCRH